MYKEKTVLGEVWISEYHLHFTLLLDSNHICLLHFCKQNYFIFFKFPLSLLVRFVLSAFFFFFFFKPFHASIAICTVDLRLVSVNVYNPTAEDFSTLLRFFLLLLLGYLLGLILRLAGNEIKSWLSRSPLLYWQKNWHRRTFSIRTRRCFLSHTHCLTGRWLVDRILDNSWH